jgi:nitroimidazol reductase NimA-like FMN-containing flavoprotein (pyridoxamine 5'-phosphate oxidase superfamily)
MSERLKITAKTKARRLHKRARYDRETVNAILDSTPLGHFAYLMDGTPHVIPTFVWREGDAVYWHGSAASRFLRQAVGRPVSLAVTQMDGLVLARSAFHHSVNYRSVILFGTARQVDGPAKAEKLRTFVEGLFPGRWNQLRPMTAKEQKATRVLWMPIEEGSAKIRTGMPVDDKPDYALPIWAGIIPLRTVAGAPEPDPRNLRAVKMPAHVRDFSFEKTRGRP